MQSANPASSNVNHGNNVNHSSFNHGDVDRGKFSHGEGLVMAAEIRLSCSDSSSASSSKLPSSQYKGVVPQPNGRWGAQIYEKHNRVWLGTFNSEEDAARTYDRAVLKFRGRDAVTNFGPPEDSDPEALFVDRHSKEQIVDMLRRHTFDEEFQLKFEKPTLNFVSGPPGHFDTNHTANRDTNHTANHDTNHSNYSNDNSRIMMKPAREHLFDKTVTPSDVGKLNRLVIPKQHAERCFPLDSDTSLKGLLLNFEDPGAKMWRFRYSYWNSSQSYVLTKGWSRFVKEKKLDAGDIISFERDVNHKLYISWHRRRQPTNYPYPTWLHQVYRPPPHSLVSLVGQSSAAATTTTRMHTLDGFKLQFLAPTSAIAIPTGLQPLYWNSPSHPQLLPQNPSQVISIPPPLPFLQFPCNMTDTTDGNATGLGSTLGKCENRERPHDDAAGILPALARSPCRIADCNVSAMSPVTVSQGFRLFGVELRPSMPCLESISQANAVTCSQNMAVSSPLNNQQSNIELRPSMPHLESDLCLLKSVSQANSLYRVQNTMGSSPSNDQQINKELRSSMPHLESDPHPSKLILHANALSCGPNTMVSSLSNDQQTSKICSWSKDISLDGGMADTNNKQLGAEISMDRTLPNHVAKRPCIDKISSNQ